MDIHLGGRGGTEPGAAGGAGGAVGEGAVGGKGGAGGSVRIMHFGLGGQICVEMDAGVVCAKPLNHKDDHQGLTGCLFPLDKAWHTWANTRADDDN